MKNKKSSDDNVIIESIVITDKVDYIYNACKVLQNEINKRCPAGYHYAGTVASDLNKDKEEKVTGYIVVAYEKI